MCIVIVGESDPQVTDNGSETKAVGSKVTNNPVLNDSNLAVSVVDGDTIGPDDTTVDLDSGAEVLVYPNGTITYNLTGV